MPVAHCGRLAVSFLPQLLRLSADFWAAAPQPPNQGHVGAIALPQIGIGGSCAGHEALARIELSPVG
jgi:hypothetical protein